MAELLLNNELYSQMFDALPNAVYLVIPVFKNAEERIENIIDFKFIYANKPADILSGFANEKLIGKHLNASKIFDSNTRKQAFEQYVDVWKTGNKNEFTYFNSSVGRTLDILRVKLDKGVLNILKDRTEQRSAERKEQEQTNRLNTLINSSQVGIFTLIPVKEEDKIIDFRFGIVNNAVAEYIGQTAETLRGDLGSKWFPDYMANGLFDIYIDTYLNNKSHHFDFHYEGGYDVYFNILTLKADDEILVTFTDQTRIKKLQLQLEKSIDELKQSNKSLEEFAYIASHDLQEPLRKINFFSERLQTTVTEGKAEDSLKTLQRIQSSTKRMQTLIEDLLTYSSISIKKRNFEDIDLAKIVEHVLEDFDTLIAEKNATVTIDKLPVIKGDNQQLLQLFSNIIGNALKYSKPNITAIIKITSMIVEGSSKPLGIEDLEGTYYLINISDNGIGFEQEYAQRIFQVFQRLHGKQEYPGTGVGLAIADKVVKNHKGFIAAESELGKGAVFKILLPANA